MVKWVIISVISLATILVMYSCQENKSTKENRSTCEIIEINPLKALEEVNLSEFVDSVKHIKLQTNSECIMGKTTLLIIKQKYIYLCDVGQMILFVFDKNGKYVSKLDKRGKGPDEYLHIQSAFIGDNEEYIEIYDRRGFLLKYSNISFNLLEKHPMEFVSANSYRKVNNNYYFATQQIKNIVNKKSTNSNIIIVKNGKVEKTLFDKDIKTNNSSFCPFIESFTVNDNKELFVSIMYDNTFYKLHDLNSYPILTVNFGKYAIDNSVGLKSIKEQMQFLRENTSLQAFFPVLNINNSEIMAFNYCFNQGNNQIFNYEFIKLKKNNKTFHTKRIRNDITAFPTHVTLSSSGGGICHEVWYDDYLVNIIQPAYEFMDNDSETKKEIDGLGVIKPEDNPIIVLMKLKKELK